MRIDERLVADGLAESRSLAQRLIMAGAVRVDGQLVDKSSTKVRDEQQVAVDAGPPFVSRGGEKLENALIDLGARISAEGFAVEGARAIDIGASTGGFTDCLLQRGAAHVVAVDVGYGQLHQSLRTDARVTVMERTNARHLEPGDLPYAPDLLVCDASFISLGTVLPATFAAMDPAGWWGVLLCKPQFEAGRERMNRHGRKGVLTDVAVRDQVVAETIAAVRAAGVEVLQHVQAHPPGPKGNVEYALLVRGSRA
ncbi:MAG: hemolysin [Thermoleophilia bacterium]|jgi:23S rRNA (cytidine1920-2'-O)/16S rRNA (cytidine1409-2'-O)-methyltransferase|nr:hemolysin [Thermoleophilia bacterium]